MKVEVINNEKLIHYQRILYNLKDEIDNLVLEICLTNVDNSELLKSLEENYLDIIKYIKLINEILNNIDYNYIEINVEDDDILKNYEFYNILSTRNDINYIASIIKEKLNAINKELNDVIYLYKKLNYSKTKYRIFNLFNIKTKIKNH